MLPIDPRFSMKEFFLIFLILLFFQPSFCQNKTLETSGDVLLFVMPAAALGTTLIKGDKKGTWQFVKGFALNSFLTGSLKYAISKERPNFENDNSFPSGHTSTTFQSAAFIHKRYGIEYGIPAYILASYTGFTRWSEKKHDFTDVLAGAVIGFGSSYIFTTPYQQEHMELTFSAGDGDYLLGFKFKF